MFNHFAEAIRRQTADFNDRISIARCRSTASPHGHGNDCQGSVTSKQDAGIGLMSETYGDNPNSYGSLAAARDLLAKNPGAREKLLDCLVSIEKSLQASSNTNVREDLTGPIVDLLF